MEKRISSEEIYLVIKEMSRQWRAGQLVGQLRVIFDDFCSEIQTS